MPCRHCFLTKFHVISMTLEIRIAAMTLHNTQFMPYASCTVIPAVKTCWLMPSEALHYGITHVVNAMVLSGLLCRCQKWVYVFLPYKLLQAQKLGCYSARTKGLNIFNTNIMVCEGTVIFGYHTYTYNH